MESRSHAGRRPRRRPVQQGPEVIREIDLFRILRVVHVHSGHELSAGARAVIVVVDVPEHAGSQAVDGERLEYLGLGSWKPLYSMASTPPGCPRRRRHSRASIINRKRLTEHSLRSLRGRTFSALAEDDSEAGASPRSERLQVRCSHLQKSTWAPISLGSSRRRFRPAAVGEWFPDASRRGFTRPVLRREPARQATAQSWRCDAAAVRSRRVEGGRRVMPR